MPGALEGVRVLDLTTMVAGPVAAMTLADQGADVIKVESPAGDLMRRFAFGRNGISAFFLSCNRNKRSMAIDMKSAEGFQIVKNLIATADVLMHNFRPALRNGSEWARRRCARFGPTSSMSRSVASARADLMRISAPTIR